MKKFVKNILLAFVIIYTILNLILYVTNNIFKRSLLYEEIVPLMEGISIEKSSEMEEGVKAEIAKYKFEENTPATTLFMFQNYFSGMDQVLYGQGITLIATLILSIAIGIIIQLKEESKMKEILYFISIGILIILLCTGYSYIMGEFRNTNIFKAFNESIYIYGPWYIVGYVLVYVFRIYRSKKKAKELNKVLEDKNK